MFFSCFQSFMAKGAMTSFGVVSKSIARSIQNRLLSLLANFKVRQLPESKAISEFLKATQNGKLLFWTHCQ